MKIKVNGIEMYYEKCGQGRPLVPGAKLRIFEGDDHSSYVVPKTRLADLILEEAAIYAL